MLTDAAHGDAIAPVVLALAVILLVAKVGGDLASRVKQPAVLGELLAGIVLGNLPRFGIGFVEAFKTDASIDLLARLGAIVLLFEVGLESSVAEMRKVGVSSFLVATFGVIVPFALGWGVSAWMCPNQSVYTHAFIGASLTATSVGITARVLSDLGKANSRESRIILGAAVIDDVLGLVLLTILSGVVATARTDGGLSASAIGLTILKALGFLVVALFVGVRITPRLLGVAAKLRTRGVLLATGLIFCFLFAWVADALGLATIVGAFAAGLVLEKTHYAAFVERGETALDASIQPLSTIFVPVFFVTMGMRADLGALLTGPALTLGLVLVIAAVVGKVGAGFVAVGRGLDRITIGVGMVPRGEVGLIFANIGLGITVAGVPLMDRATYSAIVFVVVATTLMTPPALAWSFGRRRGISEEEARDLGRLPAPPAI